MTFEDSQKEEKGPEIIWTATARRFIKKINEARSTYVSRGGVEDAPVMLNLNLLEEVINDIFPAFEKNNFTIARAEEDIRHRMNNEENEERKEAYKKILDLIDSRSWE